MKRMTKAVFSNEVTPREEKNQKIAYQAATEGIVLLKNENVLPIAPGKIALYGMGAAKTIKGGTGSGEVNERYSVSILEGLERAGFTITSQKWLADYEAEFKTCQDEFRTNFEQGLQGVKELSMEAMINIMAKPFQYPFGRVITKEDIAESGTDTCIYVVARQAGEGADRRIDQQQYHFSESEIESLKIAAAGYKNTILVVNTGASMDLGILDEVEGINAVLFYCQQGMEGGNAFADILTGKVSPSACLTGTWAKKYEDIPFAAEYSYLNGDVENENYKDGIYVGYRYFDSFSVEPRFEFGYGLSYTDFTIEYGSAELDGSIVKVSAKITNTGTKYAGKKVVQLYASCPSEELEREYQSLAAYGKTKTLQPGESELLTLSFDLLSLAGYQTETATYILEAGEYILHLGESSRKTVICTVVSLPERVVAGKCINICPPSHAIEELKRGTVSEWNLPAGVERLELDPLDLVTILHEYNDPEICDDAQVEQMLGKLTQDEMMKLVLGVGAFDRMEPVVFNAPGSAGFTTSGLYEKGLCNVTLCDGPAGLRLQRVSALTEDGEIKQMEVAMECFSYLPEWVQQQMYGDAEKDTMLYQYTTAFPVGTSLAQSWNIELLEGMGDAVGTEMEEYGVTYWLAPGMNIQRNPLCGRNYEYFSEDPLLSGKTAAAITRGVQSHQGCYVTIKHFAANNQEDNRVYVSSNMTERTLREIYLKGFEIAVQEGGAKSVMTSYNKINGVYTCNSHDLCTKVLRNEWGFDGVVMSDWFATAEGQGGNGLALKAGNDLLMPGGGEFYQALQQDLADGVVSEEDLKRCCANVTKSILNSRIQREMFDKIS